MFLRFERQRFSGGDGRPEFLAAVPVFDFTFRKPIFDEWNSARILMIYNSTVIIGRILASRALKRCNNKPGL